MEEHSVLLHLVRAVCVLDGVWAHPSQDGVTLPGCPHGPIIGWPEIAGTLAGDDPFAPAPRLRLTVLLELRRLVHDRGPAAAELVLRAARPLALPVGHPLHPGDPWVREPVPGGLLDLGLGVVRLLPGQEGVLPLPPSVAAAAGLVPDDVWPELLPLTDRLSGFAIDRMEAGPHRAALAGVGGCDALSLLALDPVRRWLDRARGPSPVSAPGRDRVMVGAAAADRDYVRAAWLLTVPAQRGVLEPMSATGNGITPAVRSPLPS